MEYFNFDYRVECHVARITIRREKNFNAIDLHLGFPACYRCLLHPPPLVWI